MRRDRQARRQGGARSNRRRGVRPSTRGSTGGATARRGGGAAPGPTGDERLSGRGGARSDRRRAAERAGRPAAGPADGESGGARRRPPGADGARLAAMDSAALLSCLATDGVAVADAAAGHLDRPVDSCPEWTVRQLVAHLGSTHSWARAVVGARGERVSRSRRDPAPEDDAALLRWYRAGVGELVKALSVDPETPAWTFSPPAHPTTSVGGGGGRPSRRRCTAGTPNRRPAGPRPPRSTPRSRWRGSTSCWWSSCPGLLSSPGGVGPKGTFHLHATDTPGEWWLDFDAADLGTPAGARQGRHGRARAGVRPLPVAVEPPVAGAGGAGGVRPAGDGGGMRDAVRI